ncbi:hypothetical protein DKK68_01205 [Bifidobacterium asteroides]|uniref:ATP-binding cassette domain-containing protein n=1 Tax=Bifidobacterium asteroides TaxID=1684 RepID=UPI000D7824FB|nr:ATP-binding cassette domain-containing protein [Bifidobacterium asteroides]PXY88813.1 hypothetical protein DKK68_01205 [Bifidobacterium asteroides]
MSKDQDFKKMNRQNNSLQLRDVDVTFDGVKALDSFTGTFSAGSLTAFTGGDGAGKTTLLKLLAGRVKAASGKITGLPDKERIGYQPADSGVWRDMTVLENLRFVAGIYHMNPAHAQERIDYLIESAGLIDARNRLGGQLSGGMRQKLGVIMAALHEPDLLLLDEPTTGVDPASREDILALISSQAVEGRTVLFATTYLDEAARASTLYLMNKGKPLYVGDPQAMQNDAPGKLWEAALDIGKPMILQSSFGSSLRARPPELAYHNWQRGNTVYIWTSPKDSRTPQDFRRTDFDLENASIAFLLSDEEKEHTTASISASSESDSAERPHKGSETIRHTSEPCVNAMSITKQFGSFKALNEVSLQVNPGQIFGLIGGNGAGKTTLIRILLGLETMDKGWVSMFGGKPGFSTRRLIGYVPQGLGLYRALNATENMQFSADIYKVAARGWTSLYANSLGKRPVGNLPLGSQRLLAYAIAAEHQPKLLVLDEPTSGMDPVSRMRLWRELHRTAANGVGILVTTHYMSEASQCDCCLILSHGHTQAEGTLEEVLRGHSSIMVQTSRWRNAFALLKQANLPVTLDGKTLRVMNGSEAEVRKALSPLDMTNRECTIRRTDATLEEILAKGSR